MGFFQLVFFLQNEMTTFLKLLAFHFSAAIVCVQKQCSFLGKQFFHQLLFHGLLTGLSTHNPEVIKHTSDMPKTWQIFCYMPRHS
jgi:hypothetical protein